MAEATILICDGCEMATSERRPVEPYELYATGADVPVGVIKADAHDWNCFGRVISRKRKAERLERAAKKAEGSKSAKK